jgi:hypothetical protein
MYVCMYVGVRDSRGHVSAIPVSNMSTYIHTYIYMHTQGDKMHHVCTCVCVHAYIHIYIHTQGDESAYIESTR